MKKTAWTLVLLALAGGLARSSAPAPVITLNPTSVTIPVPLEGPAPAPVTVTITNTGDKKLDHWRATPSAPWLKLNKDTGALNRNGSFDLKITVDLSAGLVATTYHENILVSDDDGSAAPKTCSVTVVVSAAPQLTLSQTVLNWTAPETGPNPADLELTVTNTGGGSLQWSASDDADWLTFTPSSGTLTGGASHKLTLSANVLPLTFGSYAATLTFTSSTPGIAGQTVTVNLNVTQQPFVAVTPTAMTFDAAPGTTPSPGTLTVSNNGGGSLTVNASSPVGWIAVTPTTGPIGKGASAPLTVTINTSGLTDGTYIAVIDLTSVGSSNAAPDVTVTLNINALPKIGASPASQTFTLSIDQKGATSAAGSVTNTGDGTMIWGVSSAAPWLTFSPTGGSLGPLASQPLLISANAAGLRPGRYTTTVEVASSTAINSPQLISVELNVLDSNLPTSAPAGQCGLLGLELIVPLLAAALGRASIRKGERRR